VTAEDWRWIFFVNLPIGAIVLAVTPILIPALKPGRKHRLDLPGVLLASAALFAICYGLVEGQKYDWGTITSFISIPLVIGLGVVMLAVFLLVQRLTQGKEPLVPFSVFRDRNFSVTNWVSGVLAVGMMGIFLPFTIYLQSVLGFSALKAGLTMAPASVVSMFVAPVAGRMTDKIGGKFILMSGLVLFGAGMGWMALIAHPNATWPQFLLPLIVAGVGMGCIFAPLVTVAMRNIDPRIAGAASGVLNTVRQVGLVIGTAAVGALLQNRLVSAMSAQASARSSALPPQVRSRFVSQIRDSARSGIQVGAGQNGGSTHLSRGTPPAIVAEIARVAHEVFTFAFVTAMRQTMILPICLLAIGAVSCLAISRRTAPAEPAEPRVEPTATTRA
jgi:EmrB/QacA subfamily drug resistance transporter